MTITEQKIELDPPLPRSAKQLPTVWSQSLRMDRAVITWAALPQQPGIAQLLDARVPVPKQRKGIGTRLLVAAVEQMHKHAAIAGHPLMRAFALINQPDVNARAWLQRSGFVHIHTLDGLHVGDDIMVLVRTFD